MKINTVFSRPKSVWLALAAALPLISIAPQSHAQRFCVFDPVGAQGDAYSAARDFSLVARRWGVNIELKPYTSETIAVEDFKSGQCDMVSMTGMRARQFNLFTGSADAVGGIEDYSQMRKLLQLLTSPKLAKLMVSGNYEIIGFVPLGAAYPFVNDRSINTLAKAAGKKIAVLEWDKTQAMLVQSLGAQPVASDITNFGSKFNNGQVDIIVAPIVAYKPLELYRGLGTKGAIARFPVVQLTAQIVARRDRFPDDFGQLSREYMSKQTDYAFSIIRQEERDIDKKYWASVPRQDRESYIQSLKEARLRLTKEGYYDKRMMSILKRVRCSTNQSDAECSSNDE